MLKMHGLHHNSLFLLAAVAVIALSSAFNIDFINPDVYRGEQEDFFGYEVLQTSSARTKGIIVTAPLRLNGSGGICQYDKDKTQKWFQPNETFQKNTTVVKHLGLSIAAKPTGSQFTVCSPSLAHECNDNTYLNSLCYDLSDELKQLSSYQPQFQSCTKKTVNLVFLFDGSLSMTEDEFSKNKDFIKDIMASLKNTSIKFAAVQFSADYRTVFTFSDYEAGRALNKLKGEQHMKSLTNTYRALKFVLKELFENPSAGASLDAIKVLVLITDGDPSDGDSSNIIEQYERKKIIRFVIGVKVKSMDKFKPIASEPKEKNIFKIEEYNGLEGILGNFQNRIFSVEGSTRGWAGKLINEMSQSGFSAVFNKDTLVLGSVGSNNWRGSLQEKLGQQEDQILDLNMQMDSYMGFSVSVGERRGVSLYFTGAPRFEHKGQVVLFSNKTKMWEVVQRINESQIGSYFGAELCSVDVNSDGDTDFLLVGAPMFFQPQEMKEGKVYVYMLTDELQLKSELNVTAPSMGRFGTTISSLADLNGDGLRDIAIGAPMEDDNRGAVYIYLGDNYRGIRSTFSQRISGEKFDSGIRFFGQAIDGHMDLGDDGLPDIVVGSKGAALVLRSRPVFNVRAHMSFHPEVISTENIDCVFNKGENLHMVNLTVCFEKEEATKSKGGAAESGLSIMCTLNVDPMRQSHRGFFSQTDRTVRSFTSTYDLIDKETCFDYSISMAKCVIDTLSPINIKLNFSQIGSEDANTTLNVDSKRQALVEIPFEKQCRKNDTCIAELEVDFNFISSTLLVTENNYFNVSIKLDNHGDDSYNTSLTIHYPPGLSFSRMILSKSSRPTLHSCNDLEGVSDRTVCGVSLPVYRSRSFATFTSSFHIMHKNEWNDTMLMTVTAKSDNSNSSKTASLTKSIPVQFEVRMASTVNKESVTYLNFTSEDTDPKNIITVYRIDNTGFKEFPVNVSLVFPTELEHHFELNNFRVLVKENETQCSTQSYWKSELCSQKSCIRMECDTFYLKKYSHVEFTLEGNAQFKDFKEYAKNIGFLKRYSGENGEVRFWSFIQVDFDKQKYVLASHKPQKDDLKQEKNQKTDLPKENDQTKKKSEVRVEYIIPPDQWLIILTGAGLGLLLLIIITVIMFKLGCFKRKALPPLEEEKGDEPGEKASLQEATAESTQGPTKGMITKSETNCKSDESDESDLQKGLIIFNEDNDDLQPDDSSEYQNLA